MGKCLSDLLQKYGRQGIKPKVRIVKEEVSWEQLNRWADLPAFDDGVPYYADEYCFTADDYYFD